MRYIILKNYHLNEIQNELGVLYLLPLAVLDQIAI